MAEELKLSSAQASDVEAASEIVYAEAAEAIDEAPLGRDLLALVTIFLVLVLYHVQNPLLLFETQFGSAFRSATLQPVLALGLLVCTIVLARDVALRRQRPLRLAAVVVLCAFTAHALVAVLGGFNLIGALFGIPQTVFAERLNDDSPRELLQSAASAGLVFTLAALVSVGALWQPWRRLRVYNGALRHYAPSLLVAALVIVLWEGLILVFNIEQFLLPRPSVIGTTFLDIFPTLTSIGWNTFQNAFWGFAFGCGAGVLTGILSARFISFSRALLPLAIGLNAVPIIALAPIMNNWFGITNSMSKVAIVALLTYFPTLISTVRGLTSVDPLSMELMRSYAATHWEVFSKLRLPTALPYIFSALKVSTTLSMIGAVVSEYFGGSRQGLGFQIRDWAALFRYPEAWAAIGVASLFGILFYLLVSAVERSVMPWHVSFREE